MGADRQIQGLRSIRLWIGIASIVVMLGCDRFDPSVLMPATSEENSSAPAEKSGTSRAIATADGNVDASPRDPEMQSIGPDGSQRIYYQFVDDRGRVQFVERLSDVPEAWRNRVGYVEMSQPPPLTPLEARRTWKLSPNRTAEILLAKSNAAPTARRGQTSDVVLYSASWCGYCTKARAHLDRSGIDYEVRNVDNAEVAQELRDKTGRGGIPVLDFSGEILRGYSPQQYDNAIRAIQG